MNTQLNNVRIALRHDTLSNWTQHDPQLLKGEYAAAVLSDGSTRVKIGDGQKGFSQLPFAGSDVKLISGDSAYSNDLSVIRLTNDEYEKLVADDKLNLSAVYIIMDEFKSVFGQQIKNVASPTDLSDAVNKQYVDSFGQQISDISTAVSSVLSDYLTSADKTELQNQIDAVANDTDEISTAVSSILSDYLTSDDKTELQDQIDLMTDDVEQISTDCLNKVKLATTDAGQFASSDLSVWRLSEDKYMELVAAEQINEKCLYIVSSDVESAHGKRITDVADPIELSDAVNKKYVDEHQSDPTPLDGKTYDFSTNYGIISALIDLVTAFGGEVVNSPLTSN